MFVCRKTKINEEGAGDGQFTKQLHLVIAENVS